MSQTFGPERPAGCRDDETRRKQREVAWNREIDNREQAGMHDFKRRYSMGLDVRPALECAQLNRGLDSAST